MIYLDFETRSRADIRRIGPMRYATDASTQVLCMCYAFDNGPVHLWHRHHDWASQSPTPTELIERIRRRERVEAHNAEFELDVWNESLIREFSDFDVRLDLEQMECSAAKASCLSLPRALGEAAKAVNLSERKDADGQRLINKLAKPQRGGLFCEDEVDHRKNWAYCTQDVVTERALSQWCDTALKEWPEHVRERERNYWLMTLRLNRYGFALDRDGVDAAMDLCAKETVRLNEEIRELTNNAVEKGSKRKAFLAWSNEMLAAVNADPMLNTRADTISFQLHGVPMKAGDETREALKPEMDEKWSAWGDDGATLKRGFQIALEVNRTSNSKYKAMKNCVCDDDRVHDIIMYNGADRTGRFSGKGIQPHNFVRGYMKEMPEVWDDIHLSYLLDDLDLMQVCWGDPLPALAKACRGALIASPGMELYAADFNAIEARKLAWMSGCKPLLDLFRDPKGDPYCAMASAIYQREITKADKVERQLGKKAVLGLGYAMGWEKFQYTVFMDEGIWLEDEFCQMIVTLYRKKMYPQIPSLWKTTEKCAIDAVQLGGEHWTRDAEIVLSESDMAWVVEVGTRRRTSSRKKGLEQIKYVSGRKFTEAELLRRDIMGAAGELAWCRSQGLDWPAHVDKFKIEPDVYPNWEVQTGMTPTHKLVWRPDENRHDRVYVHVTTSWACHDPESALCNTFHIKGTLAGSTPVKSNWRADPKNIGEGNRYVPDAEIALITRSAFRSPGAIKYFMSYDDSFLHCQLPSGRLLAYLHPEVHERRTWRFPATNRHGKPCVVSFPAKLDVDTRRVRFHAEQLARKQQKTLTAESPDQFVSPHLSFMGRHIVTKKWMRCGTHGGSLVENADQASSRDLLVEAMWRVEQDERFALLLSIHDEVVAEAPIGTCKLAEFESMMAEVPDWAAGMPITAEGWIGPRLRK